MTPAQVAHIMELVEKYCRAGHSTCTALADMDRLQAHYRKAIEAALLAPQQAEGWKLVPASPTMEVRKHLEGKVGVDFLIAYTDWCRPSAPTAVEPRVVDKSELKRLVTQVFGEDFQIVRQAPAGDARDAKRYRWLTSNDRRVTWIWNHALTDEDRADHRNLDAVCDAAILAAKGGEL